MSTNKIVKYNGVYIREGTYDIHTLSEIPRSYGWLNVRNKRVLDIGGCFGGASKLFLDNGAKSCITVEPSKDNVKMIKRNLKGYENSQIIHAACTADTRPNTNLYKTTSGKSFGNFSTTEFRGRIVEKVPAVNFKKLLSLYKPQVIKMDCEGCEYDLLLNTNLPNYVRQISIEIHFSKKVWREQYYKELLKLFKGWNCTIRPKNTGNNWATIGGWSR